MQSQVRAQADGGSGFGDADGQGQDASEEKAPKGKLRVWVGGATAQTRLAVGLAKGGQAPPENGEEEVGDFVWVHRGLRPGDLYEHVEVPAGSYSIMIFEETVSKFTGEENERRPPKWKEVKKRSARTVKVAEGDCQTLVIGMGGGEADLVLFNDKSTPTGGKKLRVFNLADTKGVRVLLSRNGKETPVAEDPPLKGVEVQLPADLSVGSFVVELPSPGTSLPARVVREVDFESESIFSLAIARDRYDRLKANVAGGCR